MRVENMDLEDQTESTPAFPCGSLYDVEIRLELKSALQFINPLAEVGRVPVLHGTHGVTETSAD